MTRNVTRTQLTYFANTMLDSSDLDRDFLPLFDTTGWNFCNEKIQFNFVLMIYCGGGLIRSFRSTEGANSNVNHYFRNRSELVALMK